MRGASAPEANAWVYVIGIQAVLVKSTSEGTQYVVMVWYGDALEGWRAVGWRRMLLTSRASKA
jgi:hypothetical protein